MRTIWKFETPFKDKIIINMPKNAEILCVQQDQKTLKPCIWAMVEIENEVEERGEQKLELLPVKNVDLLDPHSPSVPLNVSQELVKKKKKKKKKLMK